MKKGAIERCLGFVSILFLIFEKGDKQKNCLGFLRFVSMLLLIFEKKGAIEMFGVCKYTFFNIWKRR